MDGPEQSSLTSYADGRPVAEEAAAVAGGHDGTDAFDPDREKYPEAEETIDLAVVQVDYSVEGSGADEYPVVHVFGRRPETDDLVHVQVQEFRPYFYAPTADIDPDELVARDRITGIESGYESIRGEQLTRIYGQTPRDVGQIRDEFDHYEADVLFPNRFLIDRDVRSGIRVPARWVDAAEGVVRVPVEEVEAVDVDAEARLHTMDIEVDDRSGFPEDGEEPIVCLTTHDSFDDEYIAWLYDAPDGEVDPPAVLEEYDPLEADFEADVRVFDTEEAMLEAYIDYLDASDPDVILGWNVDDFDAPYLVDRLQVLGPQSDRDLDMNRLSRIGEVWESDWQGPDIKGRVVFDLLRAYKRTQFTELESYRLEDVGQEELGAGKETYTGDIGDLWETDPKRLLEYNLRDVELCVELDRSQGIVAFFEEVASFVGCKLEDAPTPGDAVDMYVLHKAFGKFVLPSKGTVESGEEFEGGAVFDPISGIREMVSVLDLKCFSADTDVMTPDGPRRITDIEEGDRVYTLDPDTFECEVTPVADTQQYENSFGELHHVSGNTHDFKITENHRLLGSKTRGWDDQDPDDFTFDEYRAFPDHERFAFPQHEAMDGERSSEFSIVDAVDGGKVVVYFEEDLRSFRNRMPEAVTDELDLIHGSSERMGLQQAVGKYLIPLSTYRSHETVIEEHADATFLKYGPGHRETPLSVPMDDWLELLGWFVTEGSVDHTNGRIVIHQKDDRFRDAIADLLDRLEINYSRDEAGFYVSNTYLYEWFPEQCGDGYAEKRLPEWVFDLDSDLLSVVLETMIRGDGSRAESGLGKFQTKSDQLKDDILRLAVRCGHKPTVSKQSDGTWYVSIGKRGSFKKANAEVETHDGDVYCLTAADNHVILAGRNGHFQWIGQSLYPMCMVTINASPETKVDPDEFDGETYRAPPPSEQHYRTEPDGIVREMVDELLTEREEKKSLRNEHDPGTDPYERYDRQQGAVKVIMNSLYGVSGWDRFRLYDKDNAAAVTATGRAVIEYTERVVDELGYDVTYGDTDSVMISLADIASTEEAIEQSFDIEEAINASYDEFADDKLDADEHRFQIEFEKLYRRFFQAGKKKRYAGHIVWKEGKSVDDLDVTGFEYQRSDIAPITKRVQHRVLEIISREGDIDAVAAYLTDVIEDFQAGNVDPGDVGIPGGIGKRLDNYDTDTAHVRGARYANTVLGTNFGRGSKPKRLYLRKVHPDFFERIEREEDLDPARDATYGEFKRDPDVICIEYAEQLPDEFEVDWDRMLDKTLKGPIERVIEALGLTWQEVKSGQEQTGLGQFAD